MTSHHLAQVNVGRLVAPPGSPEVADFFAELAGVNELADRSPGFVWRMVAGDSQDATGIRPDAADELLLVNCSVWESLEALRAFTYESGHLRVLARRREWFRRMAGPHQAMWWVPAGHRPGVAEAMERLDRLRTRGPGPGAFDFRTPQPAPVPT